MIQKSNFDVITAPLRQACRKSGLKLLGGKIFYGNHHPFCKLLILPRSILIYPMENGVNQSKWIDSVIVQADYDAKQDSYVVKVLKIVPEATSYDLIKICKMPSSCKGFEMLLETYSTILMSYEIANCPRDVALTLGVWFSHDAKTFYYSTVFRWGYVDFDDSNRKLPLVQLPIESIFFAATIFSLCKPLYYHCKIKNADVDFSLQIIPKGFLVTENKPIYWLYWAIDSYADMWCNFREWEERNHKAKHLTDKEIRMKFRPKLLKKFRSRWTDLRLTATWQHLNFPIIYSDHKRVDRLDTDFDFYKSNGVEVPQSLSKKQLQVINSTTSLPILLPVSLPPKPYDLQKCLTILCDEVLIGKLDKIRRLYDVPEYASKRHSNIIDFYRELMQKLNGIAVKDAGRYLQKAHNRALAHLGVFSKEPSVEQQHKACLLGAMYFVRDYLMYKDIQYRSLDDHIANVRRILGREASWLDFADFVQEAMKEKSPYHSIILKIEENQSVFLKYKKYWLAFQDYCKRKDILLSRNHLRFRKEELIPHQYIKPQYDISDSDKYHRYDYRKVISGKKELVLNVSWKLLKDRGGKIV